MAFIRWEKVNSRFLFERQLLYLDAWFNRSRSEKSLSVVNFFSKFQQYDDGCYH